MISFMLQNVTLLTVAIAALAGLVMGMVWHLLFGHFHEKFEQGWCKECERCDRDEHQCCARHGHAKGHCHDFACMAWYKFGAFVIFFAQAYGLAFVLERLNLLNDLYDALYMALFLGLTFTVSSLYAMVLWHHKSLLHFIFKALYKLAILAVMAWVIVYWAGAAGAM